MQARKLIVILHSTAAASRVNIIYKTRNSSGDEIANVNFLYHIVHVLPLAKAPSSE